MDAASLKSQADGLAESLSNSSLATCDVHVPARSATASILTMNDRFDIVDGDVSIRDGRIAAIGANLDGAHDRVIDARGGYVLPGSSRRTSISARRCFAATPTICR